MIFLEYINAFWVGGLICVIGQLFIDLTNITPARVMVSYIIIGVIIGALGWYQPLIDFAGCGASVPLSGFGNVLVVGVQEAVAQRGILGAFTGGLTAASAGISSAVSIAFFVAFLTKPGEK